MQFCGLHYYSIQIFIFGTCFGIIQVKPKRRNWVFVSLYTILKCVKMMVKIQYKFLCAINIAIVIIESVCSDRLNEYRRCILEGDLYIKEKNLELERVKKCGCLQANGQTNFVTYTLLFIYSLIIYNKRKSTTLCWLCWSCVSQNFPPTLKFPCLSCKNKKGRLQEVSLMGLT